MTLEELCTKFECYTDIKDLVSNSEYSSKELLISDVSTSLSSKGYSLSYEEIDSNIQTVLPDFIPSYYYFNNDTSILYAFLKKNINRMLLDNPSLALYVNHHGIIIKRDDLIVDGIFLSFILPEHQQIFEGYNPQIYYKSDIIRIPKNPLIWKHEDCDVRFKIPVSGLSSLYEDPSIGIAISEKSYNEIWNDYSFLYLKWDFPSELLDELYSIGGEYDSKNN